MPLRVDTHGHSLVPSGLAGYSLRRIDGVAYGPDQPMDFPVSVAFSDGQATILDADTGDVVLMESSSAALMPTTGDLVEVGRFTFNLWNGAVELDTQTCIVTARGTSHPSTVVLNGEAIVRAEGKVVIHS